MRVPEGGLSHQVDSTSFPYCRHMATACQPSAAYRSFAAFLGSTTITTGPAPRARAARTLW